MGLSLGINLSITGTITILDAGGGGGGGEVTPLVSSDFKNGVYAINGSPAAVGDVWGEDASNWGAFNPATDITAAGLVSGAPVVKHPLVDDILPGFVMVVHYAWDGAAASTIAYEVTDFPGYTVEWAGSVNSTSGTVNISDLIEGTFPELAWSGAGAHKVAMLVSAAELALSVDGLAAETMNPADNTPTDIAFAANSAGLPVEKIEFFSLADYGAADLPTLSAA